MKATIANYASGLFLLWTMATASAQTTWNYFISDAGGGNSLLTWSVSGSLATPPGAVLVRPQPSIVVSIDAPGIFADSYTPGPPQPIPAPDGSYFQLYNTSVYTVFATYAAYNAPDSGDDTFGLSAKVMPPGGAGISFLYHPGTQSALIAIDYSNFNPGIYQSEESEFDTPMTVNLTVGTVPEPSMLWFAVLGGLCVCWRCVAGKHQSCMRAGAKRDQVYVRGLNRFG